MTTSSPGRRHRRPSCAARRKSLRPSERHEARPPTRARRFFYAVATVDVRDITAENVAKAVGGTVERDGSILCCCPVHEGTGSHNPALLLSSTHPRRTPFHCRVHNSRAQTY